MNSAGRLHVHAQFWVSISSLEYGCLCDCVLAAEVLAVNGCRRDCAPAEAVAAANNLAQTETTTEAKEQKGTCFTQHAHVSAGCKVVGMLNACVVGGMLLEGR